MKEEIQKSILENATELITMGGKISPMVGGAVALLIALALAYFGFKAKKENSEKDRITAGQDNAGASGDQKTNSTVDDKIEDFLKDK
jgi:hypothetical protein